MRMTQIQHPDHLLSQGMAPPSPPAWWLDWVPAVSLGWWGVRLLAVVAPVLVAMAVYWLHLTSTAAISTPSHSLRTRPF